MVPLRIWSVVSIAKALGLPYRHEPRYGPTERQGMLAKAQRFLDPAHDGNASWSLALLQQALLTAPDGLPAVSMSTIWRVLHEAGYTWERDW